MQYAIRVKPDYQFNQAQVGGRGFVKSQVVLLSESELTDEIRSSALLLVEPADAPVRLGDAADDAPTPAQDDAAPTLPTVPVEVAPVEPAAEPSEPVRRKREKRARV